MNGRDENAFENWSESGFEACVKNASMMGRTILQVLIKQMQREREFKATFSSRRERLDVIRRVRYLTNLCDMGS